MYIFHTLEEWLGFRKTLPKTTNLGFVPTMGNLHAGHRSLMETSIQENTQTVVSIFINPTQFNRADDFTHYPRTLEADLQLLQETGVDYCLLPDEKEMYPDGYRFQIQENQFSQLMEGLHRPGHFTGVLTVVLKLLNLVQPHNAYFGEKDYQQYQLIKDMAEALFLATTIKACPTIREESGLAYSSRNTRLNPAQRRQAETFAQLFHQKKTCEQLRQELENTGITCDYLTEQAGRRFAAVMIGDIRLIDNYCLKESFDGAPV